MRGSSGATIVRDTATTVLKFAHAGAVGDRVHEQGLWLMRNESPLTPKVYTVGDGSYVMDALSELPHSIIDRELLVIQMVAGLAAHVWSKPAEVAFDLDAHLAKLDTLWCNVDDFKNIARDKIQWDELMACLTHGDPTCDNVMLNFDGDIVIIDPIPATPAVPDLKCVDIGKMLQSKAGFEFYRYGDASFMTNGVPYAHMFGTMNAAEWYAALYWCAVHFARALPYVPSDVAKYLEREVGRVLRFL